MRRAAIAVLAFIVGIVVVTVSLSSVIGARQAFSVPIQIGFERGDDWEPDVAADGRGNVYVAWAHFGEVRGCDECPSPVAMIQVSHNGGRTFGTPKPLNRGPAGYQIDLQVAVNGAGSAFVAYLQDKHTVVQRSDDFGETWSAAVPANVDIKESWTDKVGLAVQGERVYVSFSIAQRFYVSASEDGGRTFTTVQVNSRSKDTGWSLTSGGAVDSEGNVYFSWVGVHQSGNALGPQEVFLTKSIDRGQTWSFITLAEDLSPGPDCSEFACAWDFWGPQMVVSVDAADTVYVAFNAGVVDRGAPSVWFQTSRDGGRTWTARTTVHADGESDAFHLFPAIEGGGRDQVHVSWMDNRLGRFNVYYRTSSDGGSTWSAETILNADLGFRYQEANGFDFTYGDYYGLARDTRGGVHVAWGEGPDYIGPGNVFYTSRS